MCRFILLLISQTEYLVLNYSLNLISVDFFFYKSITPHTPTSDILKVKVLFEVQLHMREILRAIRQPLVIRYGRPSLRGILS